MYDTVLARNRHFYEWVYDNKVIADGFTSQKKAMDWLKANKLKGIGCTLYAYKRHEKVRGEQYENTGKQGI